MPLFKLSNHEQGEVLINLEPSNHKMTEPRAQNWEDDDFYFKDLKLGIGPPTNQRGKEAGQSLGDT